MPIPLWYRVGADGTIDHDDPIVPAEDTLPMDPASDVPPGYDESQRGQPGGFVGDPDIMDTWATSSLTPQIAGRWVDDPDLWRRVFPMDIRPQGPEIIRTWLFSTVVRSHYEHGSLPWAATTINGWILDPDRKKMSKSKGNVVTPAALFDQYGTDAVRYWAIAARPGTDTAFSEDQMKVGRRLATKLLNVTKFVLGLDRTGRGRAHAAERRLALVTDPVDRAMLARLDATVAEATTAFEGFDYARALERCRDVLLVVLRRLRRARQGPRLRRPRRRAGGIGAAPPSASPSTPCSRLLAPTLPFAAEEAWSWSHDGSIHATTWPVASGVDATPGSTSTPSARSCSRSAGPRPRPSAASAPRSPPSPSARRRQPRAALDAAHDDLVDALTIGALTSPPPTPSRSTSPSTDPPECLLPTEYFDAGQRRQETLDATKHSGGKLPGSRTGHG